MFSGYLIRLHDSHNRREGEKTTSSQQSQSLCWQVEITSHTCTAMPVERFVVRTFFSFLFQCRTGPPTPWYAVLMPSILKFNQTATHKICARGCTLHTSPSIHYGARTCVRNCTKVTVFFKMWCVCVCVCVREKKGLVTCRISEGQWEKLCWTHMCVVQDDSVWGKISGRL